MTVEALACKRLTDSLRKEVAAFKGTEEERLQAVAALRITIWATAVQVAADLDGQDDARRCAEAFAEADAWLAAMMFGSVPPPSTDATLWPIPRRAKGLLDRLTRHLLEAQGGLGDILRAANALYRETVCSVLQSNGASRVARCLEVHRASRREILSMLHHLTDHPSDA